jgi:hypothetical protein
MQILRTTAVPTILITQTDTVYLSRVVCMSPSTSYTSYVPTNHGSGYGISQQSYGSGPPPATYNGIGAPYTQPPVQYQTCVSGNGNFSGCGHRAVGAPAYPNIPAQPDQDYGPNSYHSQAFPLSQYQTMPNYSMPSNAYNMASPHVVCGMNYASANPTMIQAYGGPGRPDLSCSGSNYYTPFTQNSFCGPSTG